jgi:hypothetical protein
MYATAREQVRLSPQLTAAAFLVSGAITLTPLAAAAPLSPKPSVRTVEVDAIINPKVVWEASYVRGVPSRTDKAASGEETA